MRVPSLFVALVIPFAMFACATAVLPEDPTGGVVGGGDAGKGGDGNPYGNSSDDASSTADAGMEDTGTTIVPDTGTPVADSGPPHVDSGGSAISDKCVGTTSAQLSSTYDNACDNYFFNTGGQSNPCAATGVSCAAFNGTSGLGDFCCYHKVGSLCDGDYSGVAQCIPK